MLSKNPPLQTDANSWEFKNWLSKIAGWINTYISLTTVTAAYTVPENVFYVRADVSGGGFTVTLPPAQGRDGRQILVKKIDSSGNTLTVGVSGSDTIQGGATVTTATQWGSWLFISNGNATWERIT